MHIPSLVVAAGRGRRHAPDLLIGRQAIQAQQVPAALDGHVRLRSASTTIRFFHGEP